MTPGRLLGAVGLLLLLAGGPADAQRRESAEAVGNAARQESDAGQHAAALSRLERWLRAAPPEERQADPNVAVLRLEAGRAAARLDDRGKAHTHLDEAGRLARQHFAQAPALRGMMLREVARTYDQLGDYERALPHPPRRGDALAQVTKEAAADAANAQGIAELELLRMPEAARSFTRARTLLVEAGVTSGATLVAVLVNLSNAEMASNRIAQADAAADAAALAAAGDLSLLRTARLAQARVRLRDADYVGAEELLHRILDGFAPPGDQTVPHAQFQLAVAQFGRGQLIEAERVARAAEQAYAASYGPRHPVRGRALHTLGTIYHELGDRQAAMAMYREAADIQRAAFGPRSAQLHITEVERAGLEIQYGDLDAGERRAKEALEAIRAARLPDRRIEGFCNVLLGLAAEKRGRPQEAITFFRTAQTLIEQARGPDAQELGFSLIRLGRLLTRERRYAEAEPVLRRAVALYQKLQATGPLRLADALSAEAELREARGDRRGALDSSRRAYALLRDRDLSASAGGGLGAFESRSVHDLLVGHARILLQFDPGATAEAFEASQLAMASVTGAAMQQVAARFAVRDDTLGRLVREQQDSQHRLTLIETTLRERLGQRGSRDALRELETRREAAAAELARLNARLTADHPEYGRLIRPPAAPLTEVQAALREGEALLLPLLGESQGIVWLVTRESAEARTQRELARGTVELLVGRIRDSVDLSKLARISDLGPFDFESAARLHAALLEPFADRLATIQRIVWAPDGALQRLPPHLLAPRSDSVDPRRFETYSSAAWVGMRFVNTHAPSVSGWLALRKDAQPSRATRNVLGFGDPVFTGANLGGASQPNLWQASASSDLALRREIATLAPLPDTRRELVAIASRVGEGQSLLFLGPAASERAVEEVDATDFRVVVFATHALMAGELPGLREPAIVLTPDARTNSRYDGLLTPTEVAQLKLDADLVVLSGCNTAAGDGSGLDEGFSGLARAFLFAGARGLLASHWPVGSQATALLSALTVTEGLADSERDWGRAYQGAMEVLIRADDITARHPAFWSSFVQVGG